ncbi:MAG: DNA alkylation repair protein [Nanoarchaeota archaeon]
MVHGLIDELETLRNPAKAKILSSFFKTGKGQYGEGDVFLGVTVPAQRAVARKYTHLRVKDIEKLLKSKIHEHRLTALLILIERFKKADKPEREEIVEFYLKNTKYVNNWDLVDLTAPNILGRYLLDKDTRLLDKLAHSSHLWEKRIAIVSTYAFIRENRFAETFRIAEILLHDKHDLIHKAVGWMLREVGKRDLAAEERFLKKHCQKMPRTMLRYAIERFDGEKKRFYLGKF